MRIVCGDVSWGAGQRSVLLVGGCDATLLTVTVTLFAVILLPAASRATAVSVCCALLAVVVSQATV